MPGSVANDPARYDAVAHKPVTEAGIGRTQDALTKYTAMGVHQREGSIVADRADVTKVICEALQLRHERPQPTRSRRHLDPKRRLGGLGKASA